MNEYLYLFKIYSFFNSKSVVVVKVLIFLFFIFAILSAYNNILIVKFIFVFFAFLFINEIFLIFKVYKTKPVLKVSDQKEYFADMMSFPALHRFYQATGGYDLALKLLQEPEVRFLIEKIGSQFSLSRDQITKEEVAKHAFKLAGKTGGDYIRKMDLFMAYLMLCEPQTKMFEKSDLKDEDITNLLRWVKNKFIPKKEGFFDIEFTGAGVFDFFIFGWHYETRKYSSDFSDNVLSDKYEPTIVGRKKEYEQIVNLLGKEKGNSVILVGEPGIGKETLIEYFTYNAHLGRVPQNLKYKRVYELYPDRILSGVDNQGDLEARIGDLLADIYYSGNIIVYIQNIENIFGGGGFNFDLSGIIFEYLKDSKIQIVGTSTSTIYKTSLENRDDIKQFFEVVRLEEPDEQNALLMLFEKVGQIEDKYMISFSYGACEYAVKLASSYFLDKYLPGKAIDLLESVGSEARNKQKYLVGKDDVIKKVEERTKVVIAAPTEEEKKILLNLDTEMHKRIIDQEEAVGAVANSIRRLRSGFSNRKRPISVFLFLGPTGVGKTETAKALASIYFGDESRMIRLDMSEYQTQYSIKRLLGSMPGEEYQPSEFLEAVKNHPFSLVLLDEFEKAHPQILDVFLQVFDDGRLTDNSGRTVSFTSTIIIATSNAGSELIRENLQSGSDLQAIKKDIIDYLQIKQLFRPELLNRFDDIVLYKPLGQGEIRSISSLQLAQALKLLEEKGIYLSSDNKILDKISTEAFNIEFGARNVRRYIQNNIENFVSRMILENKINKGDKKTLTVDENGQISLIQ